MEEVVEEAVGNGEFLDGVDKTVCFDFCPLDFRVGRLFDNYEANLLRKMTVMSRVRIWAPGIRT